MLMTSITVKEIGKDRASNCIFIYPRKTRAWLWECGESDIILDFTILFDLILDESLYFIFDR